MKFPILTPKSPTRDFNTEFIITLSKYGIKQTSNENKEKYQLGDYWLIQHQILQIRIIWIVWQTVRRITNEILGVKGLTAVTSWWGWKNYSHHNVHEKITRFWLAENKCIRMQHKCKAVTRAVYKTVIG